MASAAVASVDEGSFHLEHLQGPPSTGMRRNDDRLDGLLRYAKACLKTGRCIGELKPREYYERFDAEAAVEAKVFEEALENEFREEESLREIAPSPVPLPSIEGLPPEAKAGKLRRDARDLARAAAERRKEIESTEKEINKEILLKCQAGDELQVAKGHHRKAKRELAEVRDMIRLQDREIDELRRAIDAAEALAVESAQTVVPVAQGATGRVTATLTPRPPPSPRSSASPRPVALNSLSSPQILPQKPTSAPRSEFCVARSRADTRNTSELRTDSPCKSSTPLVISAEEMKNTLLKEHQSLQSRDLKAPTSVTELSRQDAKLLCHLQDENEKLVSVIDAVAELRLQLHSPQRLPRATTTGTVGGGGGLFGSSVSGTSRGEGGSLSAGAAVTSTTFANSGIGSFRGGGNLLQYQQQHQHHQQEAVSAAERARAVAAAACLNAPLKPRAAYTSVLASRPSHYKLYIM